MMKSKTVFLIVLFSLFLNISHDFFIKHQLEHTSLHSPVKVVDDKSSQHMEACHHFFHFIAIISFSNWLEEKVLTKRIFLSQKLPLFIAYKNSFKPPKA